MFHAQRMGFTFYGTFPHTCGDVPGKETADESGGDFSPHMWGCSVPLAGRLLKYGLFPTHVGMFRIENAVPYESFTFPHTCGDVP